MPLTALALVLAAAFSHAPWNLAAKRAGGDQRFLLLGEGDVRVRLAGAGCIALRGRGAGAGLIGRHPWQQA